MKEDLKIYLLTSIGLGISLTNVEQILQIVLLVVTIVPASYKCYKFIKNEINKKL